MPHTTEQRVARVEQRALLVGDLEEGGELGELRHVLRTTGFAKPPPAL